LEHDALSVVIVGLDSAAGLDDKYHLRVNLKMSKLKNNKFHTLVGSSHPSIWTVIKWFQREQSTVTTIVQQDSVGTQPAKSVTEISASSEENPEFLHSITCNIRLSRHTTALLQS
jgi:hypothetical protein